jgi:hypothetical protein
VKYAVVIIAADGSVSVKGPFPHEYSATLYANDHEIDDIVCHVCELESPGEG